jgi:hypothetical protein
VISGLADIPRVLVGACLSTSLAVSLLSMLTVASTSAFLLLTLAVAFAAVVHTEFAVIPGFAAISQLLRLRLLSRRLVWYLATSQIMVVAASVPTLLLLTTTFATVVGERHPVATTTLATILTILAAIVDTNATVIACLTRLTMVIVVGVSVVAVLVMTMLPVGILLSLVVGHGQQDCACQAQQK